MFQELLPTQRGSDFCLGTVGDNSDDVAVRVLVPSATKLKKLLSI